MDRVILQVPMSRELRDKAEAVSADYGFSSLQELIRFILYKFVKRELIITVSEKKILKSDSKTDKRYAK